MRTKNSSWSPLRRNTGSVERSQSGRTGVYDVTVRDSSGKTIALFRGKSYRISGEVIAGLAAEHD